jgi:two-component system, LuxR family, sensor kinase FixL
MKRDLRPPLSMHGTAPRKEVARGIRQPFVQVSRLDVLEEMAASLAHELNQPLTGILNYASAGRRFIAKGSPDILRLDRLFRSVIEDAERAREIIRGIRGMATGRENAQSPVDLNCVITDVKRLLRSEALERHCVIVTKPNLNLPHVKGSSVLLQQVLLNIIINAFEAMQATPVKNRRIIIKAESGTGVAHVRVRDFGSGLRTKNPDRIFEHFFSTKVDGMGMGLTIARSIIVSHGGELAASNANGGGTCISFSLPTIEEVA